MREEKNANLCLRNFLSSKNISKYSFCANFTKFMTLFLYKTIRSIGKFWRSLITLYNHRNYNWKQQLIKSFIIVCAITARFEEMKVVDVIKKFSNDERTSKTLTMSFSYIFIMLSLHFSPLMLAWELFGNFPSLIFLLLFHFTSIEGFKGDENKAPCMFYIKLLQLMSEISDFDEHLIPLILQTIYDFFHPFF